MKILIPVCSIFLFCLSVSAQTKPVVKEPACTSETVMGVFIEADGTLAIAKNCKYETPLADGSTHKLWKEVYGVKDGKIVLVKTVQGKIVPAKVEWVN